MQVHKSLRNPYILEFIHSQVVEREQEQNGYVPGLYILLELAVGGDLFDKIAPDVGIPEDLAKFYFAQLASGIVSSSLQLGQCAILKRSNSSTRRE